MGARNHPAATTREAPQGPPEKAAVAAGPGVLPGSSRMVGIPGTSTATHFAFWDLIASHRSASAARAPCLRHGSSCLAVCADRHGVIPHPLKVPGV